MGDDELLSGRRAANPETEQEGGQDLARQQSVDLAHEPHADLGLAGENGGGELEIVGDEVAGLVVLLVGRRGGWRGLGVGRRMRQVGGLGVCGGHGGGGSGM